MDFKKYLTDDILKFWLSGIDKEDGGIITHLKRDGSFYNDEKSVWFQGRALWTFAKAYNFIEKRAEYLEACHHIYSFLPKCGDENFRMSYIVSKKGDSILKRRYYFSETFAAIGCMEYYKATGNEEVLEKAEKYFDVAYSIFKNPSLTTPKFTNVKAKGLSPAMILLATAQVMRSGAKKPEKYNAIAKEMVKIILESGFICDEAGAMLESISPEGKLINTPTGRIVNPGHSLEAAWFLISEGVYQNDDNIIKAGKHIIDITMPHAELLNHEGIICFRDVCGEPPLQLEWDMKKWWPQCEAIIANIVAYKVFGEEKYKKDFDRLVNYCMKYFADSEYGEWYSILHYDNTVANSAKGHITKGPFHLPRMLMIAYSLSKGDSILDFMK